MAYSLKIEEDNSFITLTVTGELTNEIVMEQNAALSKLANENGIDKVFVDVTKARFVGSILDQYDYGNNYMTTSNDVSRLFRLVLLVSVDDHSHDFIETISRNNGFDLTIFHDRKKAIEHLQK